MERATIKHAKSRIDGSVRLASVLLSPLKLRNHRRALLGGPIRISNLVDRAGRRPQMLGMGHKTPPRKLFVVLLAVGAEQDRCTVPVWAPVT